MAQNNFCNLNFPKELHSPIHHSRKEKVNGAEMYLAVVSGMFLGFVLVTYWPVFSLSLFTVPDIFVKVNLLKFPLRFC